MTDATTTIQHLRDRMSRFVEARQWRQYHDPKNLSMSIAIEAAELMEHFQWLRNEELPAVRQSPEDMQQIQEELADIMCYVLSFANALEIDLTQAVIAKLAKNELKYPVERFTGRFR